MFHFKDQFRINFDLEAKTAKISVRETETNVSVYTLSLEQFKGQRNKRNAMDPTERFFNLGFKVTESYWTYHRIPVGVFDQWCAQLDLMQNSAE